MFGFDDLLTGVAAGGMGLMGSYMQNSFNRDQIQQQEAFQEQMSSTAYQRRTQDMIKAGINPILAATQGGASAPSGGAATSADMSGPMSNIVGTAMAAHQQHTQQKLMDAQAATQEQTAATSAADANLKFQQAHAVMAQRRKIDVDTLNAAADLPAHQAEAERAKIDKAYSLSSSGSTAQTAHKYATDIGSVGDAAWKFLPGIKFNSARSAERNSQSFSDRFGHSSSQTYDHVPSSWSVGF